MLAFFFCSILLLLSMLNTFLAYNKIRSNNCVLFLVWNFGLVRSIAVEVFLCVSRPFVAFFQCDSRVCLCVRVNFVDLSAVSVGRAASKWPTEWEGKERFYCATQHLIMKWCHVMHSIELYTAIKSYRVWVSKQRAAEKRSKRTNSRRTETAALIKPEQMRHRHSI